jgi:hypothetical protein
VVVESSHELDSVAAKRGRSCESYPQKPIRRASTNAAPRHFAHEGVQHAADLGVPMAAVLAPISGIMALAGGLSVAVGLLVGFLVPVTLMMHAFWRLQDRSRFTCNKRCLQRTCRCWSRACSDTGRVGAVQP